MIGAASLPLLVLAGLLLAARSLASSGIVDGRANDCRPVTPGMQLDHKRFSGLWYFDSTSRQFWSEDCSCVAFKFHWHEHKFVYDHHRYDGFFTNHWRIDTPYDMATHCSQGCAFAKHGFLHGWSHLVNYHQCLFWSDKAEIANSTTDPCQPHHENDLEKFWVMKTDYKRYALLSYCSPPGNLFVMLLSRTSTNLPTPVRRRVEAYLRKHGFDSPLLLSHNKCNKP